MRFLSATYLFNGKELLSNDSVLVIDDSNCFKEIISKQAIEVSKVEMHEGIICPGFVNTHCHLELSHLRNKINRQTGFTGFATELMAIRNAISLEEKKEAMQNAESEMWQNGIVAVGDISNGADSFEIKNHSQLLYHTFIELIGLNPLACDQVMSNGRELLQKVKNHSATLAPHAPYTVSENLMKAISNSQEAPFPLCIHNQESQTENEFFLKGTGKVVELYKQLNIAIPFFRPSGTTSLQSYLHQLSPSRNLLLVHNTFTSESDIQFAEKYSKSIFWALCPNANLYIEDSLPDINLFLANNCKITIGTDSLASNAQLALISELNTIKQKYKDIEWTEMLKWITFNGALALSLSDKAGTFITNRNTGLNLIRLKKNQFEFIKKLA